ncbi:DNA polymerase III subunit gamma/tau [Treponema zioleckii]|uniref:DNA polymerase III subunit gamma/tau n=1 Tax=Treponema zioleckii TaxID=331680 RepID=UPI00168AA17D|nr:DNA polymerase III subunit gamma/tau [Treponema zioleckii]
MAYEVTATRRRPQAFDALAGQEFVAETLKNSIQSGKIAHAYLFSGPRGCGKTSTARILAKALNCTHGPTATPCGKCQQCIEITKGASTDVIEIDGASNTSVNDVRQIKDEVLFPPQASKYKIYIIDEVHMLSTSAFNALLKTIEEPPPYVIFIFATTELQKVPATIKSRCQQFNFRLVPIETVKNLLADASKEIGIQADDEALYWIARESTGSVRDAYTLFDQVAAFSDNHITYDKIRDKLGLVGVDSLNALFEDCVSGNAQEAILKLDTFLQNGISIEQFISNSTDYLRSLLLIKSGITKEALLGQSSDRFSQKVLETWNSVKIERGLSILLQLYRDIRYSLSPRYEMELAISRLSWLTEYVSPTEVKRAVDQAKALLLQSGATPAQPQVSVQPPAQIVQSQAPQVPQPANSDFAQFRSQPAQSSPAPQTAQKLPVFSALAAQQNAPEPPSESFSFGGAVPPQQTADFDSLPPPPEPTPTTADFSVEPPQSQEPAAEKRPFAPAKDYSNLRDEALKELRVKEPMLATSLMETGKWTRQGENIIAEIDKPFLQKQIEMHKKLISDFLSEFCGEKLFFGCVLKKIDEQKIVRDIPKEINDLCMMFKGSVDSIIPKSEEDKAHEQSGEEKDKNQNEENDGDEETSQDQSFDNFIAEDDEDESI